MEEKQSLWMKLEKTVGLQKLIALIALVVIFAFFAISSESFRSFDTVVSILDASYYIGFLAIGSHLSSLQVVLTSLLVR